MATIINNLVPELNKICKTLILS